MNYRYALALCLFFSSLAEAQQLTSEAAFKDFFLKRAESLDQIEGIWSVSSTQEFYRYDTLYDVRKYGRAEKIAVQRKDGKFESFNLSGEPYHVQFSNTDVKGVYLYRNYFTETNGYSKAKAVISKSGEMEYTYDFPDEYLKLRFKDSYEEGTRVANILRWTKIFPESPQK